MALIRGAISVALDGGVHAAWTDSSRGDLRPAGHGPDDGARLTSVATDVAGGSGSRVDLVAWASQVHGPGVVGVSRRPATGGGGGGKGGERRAACSNVGEYDALVASAPGIALCVLTADCGALALSSPEGIFAAVHVGWRGLLAGVVEASVRLMREQGATDVVGSLGPCIHAECYGFSPPDLDDAASVYGDHVRGLTSDGHPALDLQAGIGTALEAVGARTVDGVDRCTACGDGYFSHRARGDVGRQALVVWSTGATGGTGR
ncbi:MAG: polyphenol oxidase family protein [Acidimicrobiales bacterium]